MLDEDTARRLIDIQHKAVYVTKRVKSGPVMDVEIYPDFTRLPADAPRTPSRETQRNLNEKTAEKPVSGKSTLILQRGIIGSHSPMRRLFCRRPKRRRKEICKLGRASKLS